MTLSDVTDPQETAPPLADGAVPGLGHAGLFGEDPLGFTRSLKDAGDVVTVLIGAKPVHVITDPELTRLYLLGQLGPLQRPDVASAGHGLFGGSVVMISGTAHLARRRLFAPAFRSERVREQVPMMARLAAEQVADWPEDAPVAATGQMEVLGVRTLLTELCAVTVEHTDAARIASLFPVAAEEPPSRRAEAGSASRPLRAALADVGAAAPEPGTPRTGTLLDILRTCPDPDLGRTLSADEVLDELAGMLVAGGTLPWMLAWALYELAREPGWQRRVQAEVEAVAGRGPVTAGHLPALSCTRAVWQETTRRYAPWLAPSQLVHDTDIGGFRLAAGSTVAVSLQAFHHDETLFPEPERFAPERWLDDDGRGGTPMTFGLGTRRCPGDTLSSTQLTVQLATLAAARDWVPEAAPRAALRGVVIIPDALVLSTRRR